MIHTFKNFINETECQYWKSKAPLFVNYEWKNRTIDITNSEIVDRVKFFLNKQLNVETECDQAQIQLWPVGSLSELHTHTYDNREHGDYNSLIYLNDEFIGGEFFTETEIIKPNKGLLTFFSGNDVPHGVKQIHLCHRYTLIFWWKNTKF